VPRVERDWSENLMAGRLTTVVDLQFSLNPGLAKDQRNKSGAERLSPGFEPLAG